MSEAPRVVLLTLVWLALWSDLSVANLVSGLAVALVVVLVFRNRAPGAVVVRPVRALAFLGYFLFKLLQSSLTVARAVVTPRDRISTGIVAVPLRGCSDALATLIADAITLTPGTLTLEVRREPLTLYVHALDARRIEDVEADVRTLEVLAVRAFGDRDAIAGLADDDIRSWRGR
jgi:multicomponent Na+:H+ antiporter subunit E